MRTGSRPITPLLRVRRTSRILRVLAHLSEWSLPSSSALQEQQGQQARRRQRERTGLRRECCRAYVSRQRALRGPLLRRSVERHGHQLGRVRGSQLHDPGEAIRSERVEIVERPG